MARGQLRSIKVTMELPVRGTKKKPHVDFDFHGVAEGIEKAAGVEVSVNYSYPGRYEVPEVVIQES